MRSAVGGMKALRTPRCAISANASSGSNFSTARHHRHAMVQARQQAVEQAAGPGPVGRRPDPVARLREEIVRHLDAGQVTEQHAMGMQRALRRPGGAGGVDHHRRIVRRGRDRREVGRSARDGLVRDRARPRPARRSTAPARGRQVAADLGELGEPRRVGDDGLRAGVLQPVAQRVDAEQDRERHRDRAELVDRDVAAATSGVCGSSIATRSPRATPCAASVLASRFEVSRSQP